MDRAEPLLARSTEFRELCDDYEECAGIADRLCRQPNPSAAVIGVYRDLERELEEEIRSWIEQGESGTDPRPEGQAGGAS